MSHTKFEVGDQFCPVYPFIRAPYETFADDGEPTEILSWSPGVGFGPPISHGEDGVCIADAEGGVYYKVIGIFKPEGYPERIFYVRQWVDPDGRYFGKKNLRMTTAQAFRRLIKGYRFEYEIDGVEDAA